MSIYLLLPILFVRFFFVELPVSVVKYFASLNTAFLQMFSLPLILRTFFKPWKNEYRSQFVPMAIGIGVAVKTLVLFADIILFTLLLAVEMILVVGIIAWPILTITILFF